MAKVIMIQGTMSNAGKSLITAGLLRVFVQDGYRAAPFKSQNMALNSYITKDGLEMGRAQVMQAEACGIEPSVYMNPVLLKPTTDVGSQVIVNGVSIGNMPAKEYFAYKKKLLPDIRRAYERLAEEYDIIVVEGAGSPAEINLKENDIVNMGLARLLDAPVLLVGDIDRGGVFAQLAGTLLLLEEDERQRVKGLIINKFRGDKSILEPGLQMLTDRVNKPVLGVVPYAQLDIDDEDSLAERLSAPGGKGLLNIRILRLPRIANFTDFHALETVEGLSVQYVRHAGELSDADLILIPGSKSTIEDLLWLRSSGLEAAVLKKAAAGTAVMGICGGYQMMGEWVRDSLGMESRKTVRGMGLLPVETEFAEKKKTTQARGKTEELTGFFAPLSGIELEGYEIHMGVSGAGGGGQRLARIYETADGEDSHEEGCIRGRCMGTYLHGIFDNQEFTRRLLEILLREKGCDGELRAPDMKEYKEQQYDRLAQLIRENIDMKAVYACMEEQRAGGTEGGQK